MHYASGQGQSTMATTLHKRTSADVGSNITYDLEASDLVLHMPLSAKTVNGEAVVAASTYIPGETLCRILGTSNADMNCIKSIDLVGGSTNSKHHTGVKIHYGEAGTDTAEVLGTGSRTHMLTDDGAVVGTHFVLGPEGTPVTPQSIQLEGNDAQLDDVTTALGRELRWAGMSDTPRDLLAGSCTSMAVAGQKKRYLVPVKDASCAMGKLFNKNNENPDFCGGRYHKDTMAVVKTPEGHDAIVVGADDFESTLEHLGQSLATKSPSRNGITVTAKSFGPSTAADGDAVHLHLKINRTPLHATFGAEKPTSANVSRQTAQAYLNEVGADGQQIEAVVPMSATAFTEEVFKQQIEDGGPQTFTTPAVVTLGPTLNAD
jgi:hypothetical protein